MLDFAQIPGYAEAQKREQENRDLAFCDWPVPLCGLSVKQFTYMHLLILGNCENSFVSGRAHDAEDVAFFLWVVSPDYRPNNIKARDNFCRGIAKKVKFLGACAEIEEYLVRAFQDAPGGVVGSSKNYTSFVAPMCDLFSREYGWDDQQVLNKPVARLFQLLRRIELRTNRRAVFFNPSDSVIGNYLRNQSAN